MIWSRRTPCASGYTIAPCCWTMISRPTLFVCMRSFGRISRPPTQRLSQAGMTRFSRHTVRPVVPGPICHPMTPISGITWPPTCWTPHVPPSGVPPCWTYATSPRRPGSTTPRWSNRSCARHTTTFLLISSWPACIIDMSNRAIVSRRVPSPRMSQRPSTASSSGCLSYYHSCSSGATPYHTRPLSRSVPCLIHRTRPYDGS